MLPRPGRVLHVIVERLQLAARGVEQRPRRDAPRLRRRRSRCREPARFWMSLGISFSIGRQPETWKPPIITWTPAARNGRAMIHRAGEFVGLHADNPDQTETAVVGDAARIVRVLTRVLVSSMAMTSMGRSGPRIAALGRAIGEAEDGGKRVRRHGRAQPLHDIAVGVVMRRLDEDQLESTAGRSFCFAHPSILWRRLSREATLRPRPTPPVERFPALALLNPRDCRMAKARPPPLLGLNHIPGRGSNE